MMGRLDTQTYTSFIEYTLRVDRLDTLRDWMFNILEMLHHSGFVPAEGQPSEQIVQSVGRLGLYVASITENFLSDVYETRLSEISLVMKASFGLAMLEGYYENDLKNVCDRKVIISVLGSILNDDNVMSLISSNRYYQERLDRVLAR